MNPTHRARPPFGAHTQHLVGLRPTMADNCDCRPTNLEEKPLAYRRALALVVFLNLSMGVAEMATGIIAGSQALKADALDFLGDGAITGLGLLAIGWSARARTQAALLQGVFLAVLGLGVLATTAYRVLVLHVPNAEMMGVVGVIALVVNVASAMLLLPHREGDANMRAVWLFSRNDAVGNAAVIVAAGVVALTGTPWPDLVVATFMAGLFLHSSVDILRDGRRELREHATAEAS